MAAKHNTVSHRASSLIPLSTTTTNRHYTVVLFLVVLTTLAGHISPVSSVDADSLQRQDARPTPNRTSRVRSRTIRSGDADAYIIELGAGRRIPSGGGGLAAEAAAAAGVRRLSTETLLARFGSDFDAVRMSIDRPAVWSWTANGSSDSGGDGEDELVDDLRRLSFSYRDEAGDVQTLRPSVVRQLERWLLERARCSVRFTWEDMGTLFWPRWVRHGRCDETASCSWPPGMHCVPAEGDPVRLLHWQCRRASPRRRRRSHLRQPDSGGGDDDDQRRSPRRRRLRPERAVCRWRKVPYPVTSNCFCSC